MRIVHVAPTPAGVPGLWDVQLASGEWVFNLSSEKVQQHAHPGHATAQCPHCKASRWYGFGPCSDCGRTMFEVPHNAADAGEGRGLQGDVT